MKKQIDMGTWARKGHFEFFKQFEEPFYGVCVNVDCTNLYNFAKANGLSFYLCYLYRSLAAVQATESFRHIIEDDGVVIYDQMDAGTTVGRPNGTFGYAHIIYDASFEKYLAAASKLVEQVKNSTDLNRSTAKNMVLYSALPWINFTSLSHARMYSFPDSRPKISFGKMTQVHGRKMMPVSIHVHHGLVDGLQVGQHIDCFQELMNEAP